MSQKSGVARSPGDQGFTEKQGQYLAFIYTYSHMFRRAPAEKTCSTISASAHPRFTRWSSHSNAKALFAVNPAWPEASKSSLPQKNCQSSNGSKSTRQNLCDEVLGRRPL